GSPPKRKARTPRATSVRARASCARTPYGSITPTRPPSGTGAPGGQTSWQESAERGGQRDRRERAQRGTRRDDCGRGDERARGEPQCRRPIDGSDVARVVPEDARACGGVGQPRCGRRRRIRVELGEDGERTAEDAG